MHLKQYAAQKDICIKHDVFVERVTIEEVCRALPTFDDVIYRGEKTSYPKTTDLSTSGGTIYLTGTDEAQIKKGLDYPTFLEQERPERLYQFRRKGAMGK